MGLIKHRQLTLAETASRMQAGLAKQPPIGRLAPLRAYGRLPGGLVALLEHDAEHRRLVIARGDREPSEEELAAVRSAFGLNAEDEFQRCRLTPARGALARLLDEAAGSALTPWRIVEYRWVQLAEAA